MGRFFKRAGLLLLSLALILAVAVAGVGALLGANSKTERILLNDRLDKSKTLASLTEQFFLFEFKEMLQFGSDPALSLKPGDRSTAVKLRSFVEDSALLNHGAVLVGMDGSLINSYGPALAFPSPDDPGLQPLVTALMNGKPGLSSVMNVGEAPIVALGIPVPPTAGAKAILVGMFRADTSPLQLYNSKLSYGRRGTGYLLDSRGNVVSATNVDLVGSTLDVGGLKQLRAGRSGAETGIRRGGEKVVSAFTPVGMGGWTILSEEPEADFFGSVRTGSWRSSIALLALLVVAAASLTILNAKRHRALTKAFEYKGELLANTTHELKTPLTAIRGAAMTLGLRRGDMTDEQIDSFLGMIHRRTEGLQKLVDRILTGARLEAGREVPIAPEPLDVGEVLARIASEFVDASPRHHILVSAAPELRVQADAIALDQTLGLLVENAIKYSPDGGAIRLEAAQSGDTVTFKVTDAGVGINEEDVGHVFEAYFKATRGDRQRFAGVGLGLSIAKQLVERHGGRIWVVSNPGAETVFTFTIPAAPSSVPADALVDVRP